MIVAMILAAWMAGCASTRPELRVGAVPSDFALELRVAADDQRPGALYIVEPDRVLRAATGPDVTRQMYPAPTRLLTPGEMERVYNLLVETQIVEKSPESTAPMGTTPLSLYVCAGGRRKVIAIGPAETLDLDPLVRELDRLAWVRP
ncbi:MAG: hypothetical protein D6695_02965 [Planctomycetota bacterium]|nr:MAG: hypothetical protein D6695_02965 [Planctomycetota bacterium]